MKQLILPITFIAFFTFKVSAQDVKTTKDSVRDYVTEVNLTPPPASNTHTILSKYIAKHIC